MNKKRTKSIIIVIAFLCIFIAGCFIKCYCTRKVYNVTITGVVKSINAPCLIITETEDGEEITFSTRFLNKNSYSWIGTGTGAKGIWIGQSYEFTVIGWRIEGTEIYEQVIQFNQKE